MERGKKLYNQSRDKIIHSERANENMCLTAQRIDSFTFLLFKTPKKKGKRIQLCRERPAFAAADGLPGSYQRYQRLLFPLSPLGSRRVFAKHIMRRADPHCASAWMAATVVAVACRS